MLQMQTKFCSRTTQLVDLSFSFGKAGANWQAVIRQLGNPLAGAGRQDLPPGGQVEDVLDKGQVAIDRAWLVALARECALKGDHVLLGNLGQVPVAPLGQDAVLQKGLVCLPAALAGLHIVRDWGQAL